MRSTSLCFFVVAPLALATSVVLSACGESERSMFGAQSRAPEESPNAGAAPTYGTSDAAAGESSKMLRGSPLCGVTADTCLPDDDGTKSSFGARCAVALDVDASMSDDTSADACRVHRVGSRYEPTCVGADEGGGNRDGTDGVLCKQSGDCAPGFECVAGYQGRVCRRYCCLGSCEDQPSLNGGPTFCDVQPLASDGSRRVPICMPIKSCKLLVAGECSSTETCAIVTEKGVAGCVQRGTAQVGDPCDEQHCAAGLTCLGNTGNRRCYKLCKTDRSGVTPSSPDCDASQTCTTGSLFQDNSIGVCKDP